VLAFAWEPNPNKPITAIIGNSPGAGNELAFRELTSIINKTNPGPKFVVLNMPGADSVVSMNHLIKQAPDGYNIAVQSHMSTFVTNDIWEKDVKRWQWNDFVHVITIGKSPLVLVAAKSSRVNTPVEFMKLIATTTKPISIAVGGGAHRTAMEYLMTHGHGNRDLIKPVKFQGPLQAVTSVAQYDTAGGTEFGIMPIAVAQPLIQAGKVKPIGFTGTHKMPQYPNVPLLNDVAPGINVYAAWSITLPPNTPKDIVSWYESTFTAAIKTKEYQQWCNENVVFTEPVEYTSAGLTKHGQYLRDNFLPVLKQIDLSKE
jgi:tripartite-type tricarboxylate transporter receptor subunit TctC